MAAVSREMVGGLGREGGWGLARKEEEGEAGGVPLRVELLAQLAGVMLRGAAGGDLEAARAAYEAIGRLLSR